MKAKHQAILHSKTKISFWLKRLHKAKHQRDRLEKDWVFSYQKEEQAFRILAK